MRAIVQCHFYNAQYKSWADINIASRTAREGFTLDRAAYSGAISRAWPINFDEYDARQLSYLKSFEQVVPDGISLIIEVCDLEAFCGLFELQELGALVY